MCFKQEAHYDFVCSESVRTTIVSDFTLRDLHCGPSSHGSLLTLCGFILQVLRELASRVYEGEEEHAVIGSLSVSDPVVDLAAVTARGEDRVFVLHSSREEANDILKEASRLGLTSKPFVWIATQSVVGDDAAASAPAAFPIGMLAVHFNADRSAMLNQLGPAFSLLGDALSRVSSAHPRSPERRLAAVQPDVESCQQSEYVAKKGGAEEMFAALRNASVDDEDQHRPPLRFEDGALENVELTVLNLQPSGSRSRGEVSSSRWEAIGAWRSWDNDTSLDIKDIVWPGMGLKPPEGVPEKRFLRVSFLEEDPYVMLSSPTACASTKGVLCQIVPDSALRSVNVTHEQTNNNSTSFRCCSGFCVDLLIKFANDLSFDFKMVSSVYLHVHPR